LLEPIVTVIGEAVNLHLIIPGEYVAGGFTEAEHVLRHHPDEQATWLQPGAGMDKPLVFQPSVFIVMIIRRVEIEQVVPTREVTRLR
jgi:hypothetical protein